MKPAPFSYSSPATVDEVVALLAQLGGEGKVLAGGQSLIPILNMRLSSPAHLVDINRVTGLDTLDVNGWVRVGALARHSRVEHDDRVRRQCPLLVQALRLVAHPVIRNRGTVCGSLAHADPAGELPATLVLLGGVVEVARAGMPVKEIAAADFFTGPMEPALAASDLVVAARFPTVQRQTGTEFVEVARRHGDYAICGVGATVTVDDDARITSARAAYISVSPVPLVVDFTDVLAGRRPDTADFAVAGRQARDAVDPDPDLHASAEYRRELAGVLTERALMVAAQRAAAGDTGLEMP